MTKKSAEDTTESILNRLSSLKPSELESIIQILKSLQRVNQEKEKSIPTSIYSKKLSILEATVKYLKDEQKLNSKEISSIIKRKVSTINYVYNKAKKKSEEKLEINYEQPLIPLTIFSKNLTLFESIVLELSKDHSIREISTMLERSYRTVWATQKKGRQKT